MAQWNQKQQLYAIGGGAFLVAAMAVGGVFYTQGLIEEVEAAIATKQQALTAAETKIAQIPGLEREVVILRENLSEYVKILPDNKALSDFVRMVHQFERQSGIVGTSLVIKNAPAAKGKERFSRIEYTYDMTATLWQFMKFINLIEKYDRFVTVADFSIQSGDKGRGAETRDGDVVHTVRLSLQTYTYNGKPSGKEVQIPDYENLVAAVSEEAFKGLQRIRDDKYEHPGAQSRRDILVDPRVRGDEGIQGVSPADQRAILERHVAEIQSIRDMCNRMKRKDTTMFEQVSLQKQVREGVARLVQAVTDDAPNMTYLPYRTRWSKDVVAAAEELRREILEEGNKPSQRDNFLPAPELEQLVAQLAVDCTTGQLEEAKSRYELMAPRLAVPADDPRHAMAVAAKTWHVRASTALDFRSLDLRMQGVVVQPEGRSAVLLNGEAYEEGEYVSNDLLVKRVEEEQVWFVFRGLTLVRTR